MAITVERAKELVTEFCKEYPAALQVQYLIRDTTEELYGKQADTIKNFNGAFTPGYFDGDAVFHRGRCDLRCASFRDEEHLQRTLRHEILGHFGINAFDAADKRAVLESIIAARESVGLSESWGKVDQLYDGNTDLQKAEEVYAFSCENISTEQQINPSLGAQAMREVCIERSRPMQLQDLDAITAMVADAMRNRDLPQQNFPAHPGEKFKMNTDQEQEQALRDRLRGVQGVTPEDTKSELLEDEAKRNASPHDEEEKKKLAATAKAQAEALRQRKEREAALAAQTNSVDVERKGREIERDVLIMPRRITQAYSEVEGKFYAKDSNRLMFEDKGEKLATSTTDKAAIADMVAYAKAKQWENLKLTGSQEFRREAWLQAESQGIKTQGYTPKDADLAALQSLTADRSTNMISPMKERQQVRDAIPMQDAPRHDLNKNQAAMHDEATKNITTNLQELKKNPALADKPIDDLTKLAYWRGIVVEDNKLEPKPAQDEALARFDKQAQDPQFLQKLPQETQASVKEKTTERVQAHKETPEHTL